eukprot:3440398-Lingulodinium_polyedra.AAC.1
MGKAKSTASAWCKRYGLNTSARFVVTLYGDQLATIMARAWCHKMQHYFDIATAAQDPGYVYVLAYHDSYLEPAGFTEAVLPLGGQTACQGHGD